MKDVQELARKGRLAEADKLAQKYQQAYPDNAEVVFARGMLHYEAKAWDTALGLFADAYKRAPQEARYRATFCKALLDSGRLEAAERETRLALEAFADSQALRTTLGLALMLQCKLDEAEEIFLSQAKADAGNRAAFVNLADCLSRQGKDARAIEILEDLIAAHPADASLRLRLAEALRQGGRPQEGLDLLVEPLKSSLRYEDWIAAGRFAEGAARTAEARDCYARAVEMNRNGHAGLLGLGRSIAILGDSEEGARLVREVLKRDPLSAEAHLCVSLILSRRNDWDNALMHARRAVLLSPNDAETVLMLAAVLENYQKGRDDVADERLELYRRARRLAPRNRVDEPTFLWLARAAGEWEDVERIEQQCLDPETRLLVDPFGSLFMQDAKLDYQLEAAERDAREMVGYIEDKKWSVYEHHARVGNGRPQRLRVGYLSADFHAHATSYLAVQLFESHDRSRFETFAYSAGPDDGSATRRRVVAAFDHFVEVGEMDDAALAQRIREDGIDILVDLKGYTRDNRLRAMALRPAPVQVTYLGYPGPLGARFIDYVITDDVVTPPSDQPFYLERFACVSGSYQCNDANREIPAAPVRADWKLPPDAFVFACFNKPEKTTRPVFEVWARILQDVPDSVLWLTTGSQRWRQNLLRRFDEHGVPAERIIFAGNVDHNRHLARLQLADLALDSLPYNMHTTASDVLWAGVPFITTPGDTFASRVGASLLKALGLPELIVPDLDAYRDLAVALATDAGRYRDLRARLANLRTTSGLFDGARFAREVEDLFDQMWQRFDAGLPPQALRSAAAAEKG